MTSKSSSNLIWIIAIVILLTFLIVVVSWMSSGKLKVEKNLAEENVSEISASKKSFEPEIKSQQNNNNPPQPILNGEEKGETKKEIVPHEESSKGEADVASSSYETKEYNLPPLKPKKEAKEKGYALQVGAFSTISNAQSFEKKFKSRGFKTALKEKGKLTAVLIVGLKTQEEAIALKEKFLKENIKASIVTYP